jgi:hypothetical protein
LSEVKSILSKEGMPINDTIIATASSIRTNRLPSISSVAAPVPEKHTGMTTMLKHLNSCEMPSSTNVPSSLPVPPAVQAIIVDRVTVIEPKFAPIIGNDAKTIMATSKEPYTTRPAHCEVVPSAIATPVVACVPIIDIPAPTSKVWSATVQILAPTTLSKVEDLLLKIGAGAAYNAAGPSSLTT